MSASGLVRPWSEKADTRLGFGQWRRLGQVSVVAQVSDQTIDAGIEADPPSTPSDRYVRVVASSGDFASCEMRVPRLSQAAPPLAAVVPGTASESDAGRRRPDENSIRQGEQHRADEGAAVAQ